MNPSGNAAQAPGPGQRGQGTAGTAQGGGTARGQLGTPRCEGTPWCRGTLGTPRFKGTLGTPRWPSARPPARPTQPRRRKESRGRAGGSRMVLPGPLRSPSWPASAPTRRGFRLWGRGVTRHGRGGSGTRSPREDVQNERAGTEEENAWHELMNSRQQLLPAEPHGSDRAALTQEKGHRRVRWDPSGSPRLLQLGGGFWAPSAAVQSRPLLSEAAGSSGENEQVGRDPKGFLRAGALQGSESPKGWQELSPKGWQELSPMLPGGSGTARPQPVTPQCAKCRA